MECTPQWTPGSFVAALLRMTSFYFRTTPESDFIKSIARACYVSGAMADAPLTFPPELPISARVADIATAINDHQVVIVAGATGSGKTTQLPKIALGMGRGVES
jgi:ATP-dependent helicase HrpA